MTATIIDLDQRHAIDAAAGAGGWALRDDGAEWNVYERATELAGRPVVESLKVTFRGPGRVGYVTHAFYPAAGGYDAITRESLAVDEPGRSRFGWALEVLGAV